jgi:hypothetical protein
MTSIFLMYITECPTVYKKTQNKLSSQDRRKKHVTVFKYFSVPLKSLLSHLKPNSILLRFLAIILRVLRLEEKI